MFRLILCLVLAAPLGATAGTILNTQQDSYGRDPGWSGALDGMYSGSGGNTERILLDAGGRLHWQGKAARVRLLVSGGYEESDRQVTARNLTAHLRHNHSLGHGWASVAFTQLQSNPFQRLQSRWLLGAGLRHDVGDPDGGLATLGATPMLEIERLDGESGHVARGRLSVFLNLTRRLSPSARLEAAGYWQPLFSDLGDARAVANLALTVDVIGSVDLKLGAAVEHDARPAPGVNDTDWSNFAGFSLEF